MRRKFGLVDDLWSAWWPPWKYILVDDLVFPALQIRIISSVFSNQSWITSASKFFRTRIRSGWKVTSYQPEGGVISVGSSVASVQELAYYRLRNSAVRWSSWFISESYLREFRRGLTSPDLVAVSSVAVARLRRHDIHQQRRDKHGVYKCLLSNSVRIDQFIVYVVEILSWR